MISEKQVTPCRVCGKIPRAFVYITMPNGESCYTCQSCFKPFWKKAKKLGATFVHSVTVEYQHEQDEFLKLAYDHQETIGMLEDLEEEMGAPWSKESE